MIDDRRYDPPRMSPSVIVTIAIVATPQTTLRSPRMRAHSTVTLDLAVGHGLPGS